MPVFNNSKKIKSIYYDDKKIKAAYHNNQLVYQDHDIEEDNDPEKGYNIFVFDTSKIRDANTITLQNFRAGDTTEWDGYTDWGDGTVDKKLTHTYATTGVYTVKTKWMINNYDTGDNNAKYTLVACENINKNIKIVDYLFYWCYYLERVNLSSLRTSKITRMYYMFYGCVSLKSLDLSHFNTSNVTTMRGMFASCSSLEELNITGWNTSKVDSMGYMFDNCINLPLINVSHFNVSKVTDMVSMFNNCKVDGSQFKNWKVSIVTHMTLMFSGATIVNRLDLSNWNVSNVIFMSSMFSGCNLEDGIDISNWNIRDGNVYTDYMFNGVNLNSVIHDGVSTEDWQRMITG